MTRGQEYLARRYFIECTVRDFLRVKPDFDYIKYAKTVHTESEYVRIGDYKGAALTLNITARSLEDIQKDIAMLILSKLPDNIVTDPDELRAIAPLFGTNR